MKIIQPNSTIGIFGSGQLGRMLAIEARKMGYRIHTFSPDSETPTGQVADLETTASYEDLDAVRAFASYVDVVTFEFENVRTAAVEAATELVDVHPRGDILHTTQNRLREKTFLAENGFPVTPFRRINGVEQLADAVEALGTPAVLKTAGFGYDGKGQFKINSGEEIEIAYNGLNGNEGVLEAFVSFEKELSVVCTRTLDGTFSHYGVIENAHVDHILDVSFAPAIIDKKVYDDALEIAHGIAEKFAYVGTMCVEFFLTTDGSLLVNEIAPRPHNSGHLTFGPCVTSQFEQQLRAICGLPLGSTKFEQPAAMANLLGDLWANGQPDWSAALADKNVKLHLYGKAEPRPARKMGHLTATAHTASEAVDLVVNARQRSQHS